MKKVLLLNGHQRYEGFAEGQLNQTLVDRAQQHFNALGYQTRVTVVEQGYDIAEEIEKVFLERLGDKGIHPNVDFYSGIAYQRMGIPQELFTVVFAMARVVGWLAHWREQISNNRIFRPNHIYTGKHNQPYVPLAERP